MRIISFSAILVLIFSCSGFSQTLQRIGVVHVADAMAKMSEGTRVGQADAAWQAAAQQDRAQRVKELQDMQGQLGQLKRGGAIDCAAFYSF